MSKKLEMKRKILKAITDKAMTAPELSEKLGISRSTVRQHVAELKSAGALEEIPDEYFRKHISYKAKWTGSKDVLNDARARDNAGSVLLDQGKFADALKEFNAAIGIDPDYAEAYFYKALAESYLGNQNSALNAAERAFELEPRNHRAAMLVGDMERYGENYAKARQWYKKALELYPDYYHAKQALEWLEKEERWSEEDKKNSKWLEQHPEARIIIALVGHQKNLNDIAKELHAVLESKPRSWDAMIAMGVIEAKRGNAADARKWYKKALKYCEPHFVKYYRGEYQRALKFRREI